MSPCVGGGTESIFVEPLQSFPLQATSASSLKFVGRKDRTFLMVYRAKYGCKAEKTSDAKMVVGKCVNSGVRLRR
ncbi:hypothetical protein Plhal304r1_c088g0170481 [Plasmopara halstedii]